MKRYRIYTGRYGGELTIGKITPEFFEYYLDCEDTDDLIMTLSWGADDEELDGIPAVTEDMDYPAWHDVSELMHISGPYSDSEYEVYAIDEEGNDIGDMIGRYSYNTFYGQECYHQDNPELESSDTITPILACHSSEKGGFGEVIVECEGDFDPDLFGVTIVESNLCEIVSNYFYDGKELEVDWGYSDTMGKAFYSSVGYINKYFEAYGDPRTEQWIIDSVENHYSDVREEKKNGA